jgi:hypothetical protein
LTLNGGGFGPSTVASTVQYSCGHERLDLVLALDDQRTATDCTRPADSPRRTFVHSTGLIS